jgi:hypothetical protein
MAAQVVIQELHYHPDEGDAEFVEIANIGGTPVDISGWCFTDGIDFCFVSELLSAGEIVVLARDAAVFQATWGIPPDDEYSGSLSNGGEAIVLSDGAEGIGSEVDRVEYDDVAPWPTLCDGEGPSLERIDTTLPGDTPRNWRASIAAAGHTAAAPNSVAAVGLPPFIVDTAHDSVDVGLPIVVTAEVFDATAVALHYVIDFGSETSVPMADDGASGDGASGDGVYGGSIPGQAANSLVRYRIVATGPTGTGNDPRVDDTIVHRGTMVEDATSSDLPIIHWWMHPDDYQAALDHYLTNDTEPALVYYNGRLWDNVQIRVRGGTSREFPKKSWKFVFPQGNDWQAADLGEGPNDDFNLRSGYADKSFLRDILAWEAFADSGAQGLRAFPVRVHQNGSFFGLYTYLEHPDGEWVDRVGLDEDGALYKAEDYMEDRPLEDLDDYFEKEQREDEDYSDLDALIQAIHTLTGDDLRGYLYDALDLPTQINYLAVTTLIHNNDHVAKNYFLYRDTEGSGRWTMLPWDLDLTFGRIWQGEVLNDDIFADDDVIDGMPDVTPSHPRFGDCEHLKWDILCNHLIDVLFFEPETLEMYYRRLRTLMDAQLVSPLIEDRIDVLQPIMTPEAALDAAEWGQYGSAQTLAEAVAILEGDYLAPRRTHLFSTHRVPGEIPPAQSTIGTGDVVIHEIQYAPTGGGDHEFVELQNRTDEALDLSGWTLDGISGALPPGTVLLPGGYLILAGDDSAFRAEYGGGRFVPLDFSGSLEDAGEALVLRDAIGTEIDRVDYGTTLPWPPEPAGGGPSLSKICPSFDGDDPASWEPSAVAGGTPGSANGDCLFADGFETGDLTYWIFGTD